MIEIPAIAWHHGTCDNCKWEHILVIHFGYNTQREGKDYRLCIKCLYNNFDIIMQYNNEMLNLKRTDWRMNKQQNSGDVVK